MEEKSRHNEEMLGKVNGGTDGTHGCLCPFGFLFTLALIHFLIGYSFRIMDRVFLTEVIVNLLEIVKIKRHDSEGKAILSVIRYYRKLTSISGAFFDNLSPHTRQATLVIMIPDMYTIIGMACSNDIFDSPIFE